MTPKAKGNLAMSCEKVFAGLDANALRYLLPVWMSAVSGSVLRLCFGAAAFWLISLFTRREATPVGWRMRLRILLLGMVVMYGFMITFLLSLSYTTPLTVTIISCTGPVWVLILAAIFLHVKVTRSKIIGVVLGLGGSVVCLIGQKPSSIASDPTLGIIMSAVFTITYSVYLIMSKPILEKVDLITFNKWLFLGGAIVSLTVVPFTGWDAPVLRQGILSTPFLILAFVLVIPTVLDYYLSTVGLKYLSATTVAIYGYVKIVVVMVVGYIVGQDIFEWYQVLAVALVVASVYFVEIAGGRKKTAPAQAPR